MITVSKVQKILKTIIDPEQGRDILSLGCITKVSVDNAHIQIEINPRQSSIAAEKLTKLITDAANNLPNIKGVDIQLQKKSHQKTQTPHLQSVKKIIAVSSCKGGVGKSTLAAHLAKEATARGLKVGLLDADLHGPSIPTLLNVKGYQVQTKDNCLIPIHAQGITVMSFGFLLGDAPAVMRGPIVTRYIQQILTQTLWGDLDILFIDMPPGTSDVHITITQTIRLTGAIIVTTPHTLSVIDVARGILMFEKVNVPILGIIENMSYLTRPDTDEKVPIFGESSVKQLQDRFGVHPLGEIPILPALSQSGMDLPQNSYIMNAFDQLLVRIQEQGRDEFKVPEIRFDANDIYFSWPNGEQWQVNNFQLRLNSKDALSVNEMTGEEILKEEDIRKDIAAKSITPLGNYAVNVSWNDGHCAGIYPYPLIEKLSRKTSLN